MNRLEYPYTGKSLIKILVGYFSFWIFSQYSADFPKGLKYTEKLSVMCLEKYGKRFPRLNVFFASLVIIMLILAHVVILHLFKSFPFFPPPKHT